MKVRSTITFIISKNYGPSLSWSVPVWNVYAGGLAAVLLTATLVTLSVLYLVSYHRLQRMERETQELRQERDALKEQILSANQKAFEEKGRLFATLLQGGRSRKSSASLVAFEAGPDEEYVLPIRVSSYTTRINSKTVEISFRLENQSNTSGNRGGFLFVIFENQDQNPRKYQPSPSVNTNEEGFPLNYKRGIRFLRFRNAVTFRRKIRRNSPEEYFTHVNLFLFTNRGGLILKEQFNLEKSLFLRGQPSVKTQQLSKL